MYPDLVIADYCLAKGELGTDVVARLRNELGVPIPAVLVSGDSSANAIAAMRAARAEVVLKPVLPEDLRVVVDLLLRRRDDGVSRGAPGEVSAVTEPIPDCQ